jgi:hypothetical protein
VRPSALESAKLALYAEMTIQGVRKSELAQRLGCPRRRSIGCLICAMLPASIRSKQRLARWGDG